jgi:hypothetical protein
MWTNFFIVAARIAMRKATQTRLKTGDRAGAPVRQSLITISLALAVAFSALAQNPATPDLSGTWVLNTVKSKISKHVTIGAETIVVTCTNSTIQFDITSDGKESIEIYFPDGKEHVVKELQGSQLFSRAQWKKSMLITESGGRIAMPNSPVDGYEPIHEKERWTLTSDGSSLIRELGNPKQVFVYDKQ